MSHTRKSKASNANESEQNSELYQIITSKFDESKHDLVT